MRHPQAGCAPWVSRTVICFRKDFLVPNRSPIIREICSLRTDEGSAEKFKMFFFGTLWARRLFLLAKIYKTEAMYVKNSKNVIESIALSLLAVSGAP